MKLVRTSNYPLIVIIIMYYIDVFDFRIQHKRNHDVRLYVHVYNICIYIYINIVTTCNAFIFMSEFHNGNLFGCYRVYKKNI